MPEEAAVEATDKAAAPPDSDAFVEPESFLSLDEALHSIHEEPEEDSLDQAALQPQLDLQGSTGADLAKQGQSRRPSFTQPGAVDRQNTQTGQYAARFARANCGSFTRTVALKPEARVFFVAVDVRSQ